MDCRFCGDRTKHRFVDLGSAPPSNSFLSKDDLSGVEKYFPLDVMVCESCFLVQIDEFYSSSEIFDKDYVYFSSFSTSWLKHCENYVDMISERLGLNENSNVCEVASNDGYLLQYFNRKGIPCFGVEPTASTADVAISKGIKTYKEFFGENFVNKLPETEKVDLVLGNNVYAHVPDINDFTKGLVRILKPDGVVTLEFPHLYELIEGNQFDTIYHEHFSYLSLTTVSKIFKASGLEVFDVERIPTHGGSLRVYGKKETSQVNPVSENVEKVLTLEKDANLVRLAGYEKFQETCFKIKIDFLKFLLKAKEEGKSVVGYGAAAKGNTLMNYCGVKSDLIDYVCDKSPYKQNKSLPGSRIPVFAPEKIKETKPAYVIIFPWNLKTEIMEELNYIREWNSQFVVAIPGLEIF